MCLQQKILVKSHLMPAALYDYCRKGEHRPIKVGGGFVIPTDRQTQDYLLCDNCEDLLNNGGERWILSKLATWERTFPLYDLLTKIPPLFDEDGMVAYLAAQNPEIEVEKLTHFALGLFWKASVHSWKGGTTDPRIDLGPYSEEIRKWLRGQNVFPKNVYLIVVMEKPQKAQITMNDPYEGVRQGWRTHFFHVPRYRDDGPCRRQRHLCISRWRGLVGRRRAGDRAVLPTGVQGGTRITVRATRADRGTPSTRHL
jgi:hypothetical protein